MADLRESARWCDLERALIIGEPTDEMRRLFDRTVHVQQFAFDSLRPGVPSADVDLAVLTQFEDNDLMPHWRQHVGHAIGLRDHEAHRRTSRASCCPWRDGEPQSSVGSTT